MPTLEKIAKALDVEIEELFNFNHNREKDFLINETISLIKKAPEDKLKIVYRVVKNILN